MARHLPLGLILLGLAACAPTPASPSATTQSAARPHPCFAIHNDSELRAKDATKTLDELAEHIKLAPEDEALRNPKSNEDIRRLLRRDTVYLFANAAAYAHSRGDLEGRFDEAMLELLLGESQLVASQVLTTQEAWVGGDLRIARANLATEGTQPSTDRGRMLAQLIRVVEEGSKIADALGIVASTHLVRGGAVIRQIEKEAPNHPRTLALVAEYHRLRGEWPEFDAAIATAEAADRGSAPLCYLRGMEQLERHRRPDLGANIMRDCLKRFPHFVRAQAALVLMSTTPSDGLREIERLKAMNQDHYLVMLIEPTLAADEELMRMQRVASSKVPGHAP
jgi:hypothetical protein